MISKNSNTSAPELEPTLYDVLKAMNAMDMRINGRMDMGFNAINNRMDNLDSRLGTVEKGVNKLAMRIEDVQDTLIEVQEDVKALMNSRHTDAVKIVDHERRITTLEKTSSTRGFIYG